MASAICGAFRPLAEVLTQSSFCFFVCFVWLLDAWLLEFCRTLEIIARTLREVVNRVRLCGHHNQRCSIGEVHVYGAVMRRGGEGGDWCCIDSVLRRRSSPSVTG